MKLGLCKDLKHSPNEMNTMGTLPILMRRRGTHDGEFLNLYIWKIMSFFNNSPICDEPQLQVGSTCIPSIFLFIMWQMSGLGCPTNET
jgi:hypothetical protein